MDFVALVWDGLREAQVSASTSQPPGMPPSQTERIPRTPVEIPYKIAGEIPHRHAKLKLLHPLCG